MKFLIIEKTFSIRSFPLLLVALSLFSLFFAFPVRAQTSTTFAREDQFDIPSKNSTISFTTNGSYQQGSFKNNIWFFQNLKLGSSQSSEEINLQVSAQDCEIRIISCQVSSGSFLEHRVLTARLRYSIVGEGAQSFNLGLDPKEGDWNVIFNGEYTGENNDWRLSHDNTLTINKAHGNVTLIYYGYPESYIASLKSNSFLTNHHVSIAVTALVVIIVFLAAISMAKTR